MPAQWCVPSLRTEVVWTDTVALVLDWLTTLAASNWIDRSPT